MFFDSVLLLASVFYVNALPEKDNVFGNLPSETTNYRKSLTLVFLVFSHFGLLMVDHIHFQYNGFLQGILVISIAFILRRQDVFGAIFYAILCAMVQIRVFAAPVTTDILRTNH